MQFFLIVHHQCLSPTSSSPTGDSFPWLVRFFPWLLPLDFRVCCSLAEPVDDEDLSVLTLSLLRALSLSPPKAEVVDPESDTSPGVPALGGIPVFDRRFKDAVDPLLARPEGTVRWSASGVGVRPRCEDTEPAREDRTCLSATAGAEGAADGTFR